IVVFIVDEPGFRAESMRGAGVHTSRNVIAFKGAVLKLQTHTFVNQDPVAAAVPHSHAHHLHGSIAAQINRTFCMRRSRPLRVTGICDLEVFPLIVRFYTGLHANALPGPHVFFSPKTYGPRRSSPDT